jgi:hypothetical protein
MTTAVARRKTRIAQIALRLDREGRFEKAAGVYAERKNRRTRRASVGQARERQATIPNIEQSRSITDELVQTLTLIRTPEVNSDRIVKI